MLIPIVHYAKSWIGVSTDLSGRCSAILCRNVEALCAASVTAAFLSAMLAFCASGL